MYDSNMTSYQSAVLCGQQKEYVEAEGIGLTEDRAHD